MAAATSGFDGTARCGALAKRVGRQNAGSVEVGFAPRKMVHVVVAVAIVGVVAMVVGIGVGVWFSSQEEEEEGEDGAGRIFLFSLGLERGGGTLLAVGGLPYVRGVASGGR